MNKTILGALAFSAFFAAPVMAADMRMPVKAPPAPVVTMYSWTGCYFGIHGGFARSRLKVHDPLDADFEAHHDVDGFLIGGQLGCNLWQNDRWVFGIEGQAAWADIDGERQGPFVLFPNLARFGTEIDVIGSLAARLGYAFGATGQTLVFVKGGAAFMNIKHSAEFFTPAVVVETDGDLRWGWMVGAGFEHAFGGNWSFKAEYNFSHFGTRDVDVCLLGGCDVFEVKRHVHLVKFGINYRFGGGWGTPVAARY